MLSRIPRGFVLRKIHGVLEGCSLSGVQGEMTRMASGSATARIAGFFAMVCLVLIAVLAVSFGAHRVDHSHVVALTGLGGAIMGRTTAEPPKKSANIRKMEADMKALMSELEAGQVEMAAGIITPERGEELSQKAHEVEALQAHLDQYNEIAGITSKARGVARVTLPGEGDENYDRKSIVTTPGHLFVVSSALAAYQQSGKSGWSAKVPLGKRFGRKMRLTGEQAREFEKKAYDPANLPVLGDDAIIPVDRDPELIRFAEPEILTLRDVLNTTPTTSDSIKFVRHISTTRGAATVARGGPKPFMKIAFEPDTVSVETIAVLSKVTEQDVDDAPRLIGYINGEMTLDIRVEEERQIAWGNGSNELLGLFDPTNDIAEFDRAEVGDTIIDTVRRMRTDLRKNRVTPNFVAIDPVDWEDVELRKGSDERYIWGLITDLRGPRIWSLRVVESDAMTNPETGERRMLMGDGIRGATVYDRNQVQLAVGFMDDDFGRNLRTLRAEERLALAVKRPFAFEYVITGEAAS